MNNQFRKYSHEINNSIRNSYLKLRTNQTLKYNKMIRDKYLVFNNKMSIWEAIESLDNFIDISDPDINLPNLHHLLQTAEAIRKDGYPDWMQLVGLIHDLGKVIYLKGCDEDGTSIKEQWGIVGDTFIVGCKIPDSCVYSEFNKFNPDNSNKNYNTKLGIYENNCGLSNCYCSFGHDEYLYQVLLYNKIKLPEEAMYMIRYHSLYPWHKEGEYKHLMDDKDFKMLKWVKLFNKYDLYSKEDNELNIQELKKYYSKIVDKYIGKDLYW